MAFDERLISYPAPVFWRGWESTTLKLHRAGWRIAVDQSDYDHGIQLAINNEYFTGVSRRVPYNRARRDPIATRDVPFEFELYPEEMQFAPLTRIRMDGWAAVDPIPSISIRSGSFSDFIPFKTISANAEEVFLEEASLQDILEIALSKQVDRQDEIRKRIMKDRKLDALHPQNQIGATLRLVG